MAIDLSYINQFGIDVAGNVQNITALASSINSFMTIPDEAKCIDNIYLDFDVIGKRAIETRTYNWARLGELLFHLQDRYNKDPNIDRVKNSWTKFAAENFTNFGKRRREQAVKLYSYGKELERFYFLGIDEVLFVFGNLIDKHKIDKENLKKIATLFDFSFKDPVDTDDERRVFKEKVNKICAYNNSKTKIEKLGADDELYYRCISVGCNVTPKVLTHIESLKVQAEKDEYLRESIANRAFKVPGGESQSKHAHASIGLLCKITDNTIEYRSRGLKEAEYIKIGVVTEAIRELVWLRKELRKL